MSRSGYSDECDGWDLVRWRGAVNSAINGKRGQAFLHELIAALDAMPVKQLIVGELQDATGAVCALGCVGKARHLDMRGIDIYNRKAISQLLGIAPAMAAEIMFENDDSFCDHGETPEERWAYMRAWAVERGDCVKLATPPVECLKCPQNYRCCL